MAIRYAGSCHCGTVAYTVEVDTDQALKCHCTICTKLGAVWALRHRKLCRGHGS
jgi:hypothetical protein